MQYLHHDLCQEFVDAEIATWFYENGSWRLWDHDHGKFKIEYPIPGQLTSTTDSSHSWRYPPKDDCNDCNEEREQIIIQCGDEELVDWSNWNQNLCSGAVCNPKINNNQGPPVCLTEQ